MEQEYVFSEAVPVLIMVFGIITIGYGIGSIVIMVWAWRKAGTKASKLIKYMAIAFLALFIIGSMDSGIISGLEFMVILAVSLLLWVNCYSIIKIAQHKECLTSR